MKLQENSDILLDDITAKANSYKTLFYKIIIYWSLIIVSSVLTSAMPCMALVKTVASFRDNT